METEWIEKQVRFWYGDTHALVVAGDWAQIKARILHKCRYGKEVKDMLDIRDVGAFEVKKKYGEFGAYRFKAASDVVSEFVYLDALRENARLTPQHRLPVIMVDCIGPDASLIAYNRSIFANRMFAVLWPLEYHYAISKKGLHDRQPFRDKVPRVVFRGALSGPAEQGKMVGSHEKSSRLAIVHQWRTHAWADVGLSSLAKDMSLTDTQTRDATDATLPGMDAREIMRHKYVLCIEGADISSGFGWVLASNCVPMHPYPFCFEVWFFSGLEPWVHFVPILPDGSDLKDKYDWCETHPDECASIALAGRTHMRKMLDDALIHRVKSRVVELWDLKAC